MIDREKIRRHRCIHRLHKAAFLTRLLVLVLLEKLGEDRVAVVSFVFRSPCRLTPLISGPAVGRVRLQFGGQYTHLIGSNTKRKDRDKYTVSGIPWLLALSTSPASHNERQDGMHMPYLSFWKTRGSIAAAPNIPPARAPAIPGLITSWPDRNRPGTGVRALSASDNNRRGLVSTP